MPFDRLVRAVDQWAAERPHIEFYAQIGPNAWKPGHVAWTEFLNPEEYREHVEAATTVVAHAGIGSIIAALELRKPILIMPRHGELGETRNDHQVATARRFEPFEGVKVAYTESQLLIHLAKTRLHNSGDRIPPQADDRLIQSLKRFIVEV